MVVPESGGRQRCGLLLNSHGASIWEDTNSSEG